MILEAKEAEVTWLPGFNASALPRAYPKGITLHTRDGELGVEPQGIAGALPLSTGDTLQIVPKIGKVNFLRLLFRSEGRQHQLLNEFDDFVQYFEDEEASFDTLVARSLLHAAAVILSRSAHRGRLREKLRGYYASGSIEVKQTVINGDYILNLTKV